MMASDLKVRCVQVFRCDRQRIGFLPHNLPGFHVLAGGLEHQGIIISFHLLNCLQNHIVYSKARGVRADIFENISYSYV